ncbi:VOC family protein [Anaerocolumna sp. MB42-C2]|uniref:VOC family protein n=1 Tax=Anaerocolumna sp. MB42-C2 TaxID=3070997 RepID=UPI0027E1DFFA|nr:VOC family protein [Anaerocolumna sp. MB42-C2]WMJ87018.1 VOC family protein [Anaerocolumna sp. MB42-C2]
MPGFLDNNQIAQVGFIVRDIEESKRVFADFLGVPVPPTYDGGTYDITGTTVDGKPAPDANCFMAFFDVGPSTQIELIQPNGAKSTWQDFLDEHGEGIHHIAFQIKDMDIKINNFEKSGMKCIQRGKYGSGNGEYAYMDANKDMKCLIELLENY